MPTITLADPTSAAAEAVGSFLTQKRNNELDALARDHQQKRDARADLESDRNYGLSETEVGIQKKRLGLDEQTTASRLASDAQTRSIEAADAAIRQHLAPLNEQLTRLQVKGQLTANEAATIDLHVKTITSTYAASLAKAGLSRSEAEARAAQITAQYAGLSALANIGSTNAGADASRAGAAASFASANRTNSLLPGEVAGQNLANAYQRDVNANALGASAKGSTREYATVAGAVLHAQAALSKALSSKALPADTAAKRPDIQRELAASEASIDAAENPFDEVQTQIRDLSANPILQPIMGELISVLGAYANAAVYRRRAFGKQGRSPAPPPAGINPGAGMFDVQRYTGGSHAAPPFPGP